MDLILPNSEKEVSEEKRRSLMELRKGFDEVRSVLSKLEHDLTSPNEDTKMSALWIGGQLMFGISQLFQAINTKIEDGVRSATDAELEGAVDGQEH